jgi:uncharacterized protein (TIGR02118 family)
MIKVSVLYPAGDDATFDMDYYKTTHMEIVERTMKPSKIEIEDGQNGPYIAIGSLYFDSPEAMQAGVGASGEAMADVSNFTNTTAAMQVSAIVER